MNDTTDTGRPEDVDDSRISRREAMRRAAALGAVTIWAAPAVQGLGRVAAFAQSPLPPPPPPPPPPPGGAEFPSNVQMLVVYNATVYGFKYDEHDDSGWDWHPSETDGSSQCLAGKTWQKPTDEMLAFWNANVPVTKSVNDAGFGVYTLTVPLTAGYVFQEGYAKCGTNCPAGTLVLGTTSTYEFSCG